MLKTVYDNQEDIPEGYAGLYTEKNGKWELTGVQGIKTQADIDRLQGSLTKERADHKKTRETLQAFGDLNAEEIHQKLENYDSLNEQLEALKSAGPDDEKIESIVKSRVNQALGPIEREKVSLARQLDLTKKQVAEKDQEVGNLRQNMVSDRIERAIRDGASAEKVISPAIGDAVLNGQRVFEEAEDGRIVTKDGIAGVTPGLTVKEWLNDQKDKAPHWWAQSVGGGSRGGGAPGSFRGADNPWSKEGWNITKQGVLIKTLGLAKAEELAKAAGSKIGATKPAKDAA